MKSIRNPDKKVNNKNSLSGQEQKGTNEGARLEKAFKEIDAQREYKEGVLADKFYKRKEALQRELGGKDQNTWIRDQANKLMWEMASWVKGQEASPLSHSLFKYRYDWRELRNALEDVKDGVTIQESPAEATVREVLAMAYEDRTNGRRFRSRRKKPEWQNPEGVSSRSTPMK